MSKEPLPRIPGYRVVRALGSGGTGAVYLAEHVASGLEVAIKILSSELMRDATAVKRFVRGGELVAKINHPNVITVYEVGRLDDGRPYQVMEHCAAEDLSHVMARRPRFGAAELWPYVQQLCLGLHVAHEGGVIHRDIKPENILVTAVDPLRIRIIDFDVARPTVGHDLTRESLVVGTPHFVSPERLGGAPLSRATDIYALGVLIYWMLSGSPPFRQQKIFDLLRAHLNLRPISLAMHCPLVPAELVWLVHRCLEKDPQQRPPTTRAVAQHYLRALVRAGEGETIDIHGASDAWRSGVEVTKRLRLEDAPRKKRPPPPPPVH